MKHVYTLFLIAGLFLVNCQSEVLIPEGNLDLSEEWQTAKPASVGLDEAQLKEANKSAKEIERFKSLLVVKDGLLVYEKYYNRSEKEDLNDVRSVTKSLVASLTGIALKEGFIGSLDDEIGLYLDTTEFAIDPAKREITIKHLLTMTGGFKWEENTGDSYNQWIRASDQIDYVLEQPLSDLPGGTFNYNSGAVHLLGVVIEKAVGMKLDSFADKYLFQKLGITQRLWEGLSGGFVNGGSGIDLLPRDLARIGQFFLQNGQNSDEQILPENWIEDATNPILGGAGTYGALQNLNYGYLFWLEEDPTNPAYIAWGYGGQFIYVIPSQKMVIITTTNWNSVSQDGGVGPLTQSVLDVIVNQVVSAL